jgi:hypothetical protein
MLEIIKVFYCCWYKREQWLEGAGIFMPEKESAPPTNI